MTEYRDAFPAGKEAWHSCWHRCCKCMELSKMSPTLVGMAGHLFQSKCRAIKYHF